MQLKTQMSLVSDMGLNTLKDCMYDWSVGRLGAGHGPGVAGRPHGGAV